MCGREFSEDRYVVRRLGDKVTLGVSKSIFGFKSNDKRSGTIRPLLGSPAGKGQVLHASKP